jgi:MinD-like ATPase involved in chromosome partitioning or flagellar assembly
MLRDELIARCRFHLPDSLLVCSPRSTPRTADIVAHLALALAWMNEEILVIDANLGEQTLTRHFDAVGEPGLCDVLTGHQDAWQAVRPTSQTRLSLLASGDDVHGISRVRHELNPEVLSQLLLAWQRHFHRVLIDVGEVDAALAEPLGRASETILLVVPHPQPNENVLRDTATTLARWKTHVLGCVLTDVPARGSAS